VESRGGAPVEGLEDGVRGEAPVGGVGDEVPQRGNQLFSGIFANVEIDCFHSSLWRSETKCTIAV